MLDVREVCRVKWSMISSSEHNCFDDRQNPAFTGCSACKRQAETMTMDEVREDMRAFIAKTRMENI